MAHSRFGSKQDEYNFFSDAFKLIDEQRTESLMDILRSLFMEVFCTGRCSECFPAYEKLASQSRDGLLIENWNEIPLWRIRRKGFAGYEEALEEIFRRLSNIYKACMSDQTRCRVAHLMQQAVGILKKRICQVERGGLVADARVTGTHLHVIELWTRCLKMSMEEVSRMSYEQEVHIFDEEPDDFQSQQP